MDEELRREIRAEHTGVEIMSVHIAIMRANGSPRKVRGRRGQGGQEEEGRRRGDENMRKGKRRKKQTWENVSIWRI